MLNNVPAALNRMARNVVINHPNTFNCQLFRKVVTRAAPETVGGLPTLGGLGVLESDDEESFKYEWIGNGYAMPAEPFQPSPMMDRGDANNGYADEFRFLIEPEDDGAFSPQKHDVLYLLLGEGATVAKLAFEVVDHEAVVNIPPYSTRYICSRRDDLHVAAGTP